MSKNVDKTLAQQLRSARVSRRLSQEEVARLAGVSRATVVALERSPGTARVHSLLAAARACGLALGAHEVSHELLERRLAREQQARREEERYARHMQLAAQLLAGKASEPLRKARQTVAQWARNKTCSAFYIAAWESLLEGSPRAVGTRLAEISLKQGSHLFQNTPFGATVGAYRPQHASPGER